MTMQTAWSRARADVLIETLEPRILLAADGIHAIAIVHDPVDGLRFGSATADAQGTSEQTVVLPGGLDFTFDDATTDESIRAITFLGRESAYDLGISFADPGDPYAIRTSLGLGDGHLAFTFGWTPETGAWSLIVLETFELDSVTTESIAADYAANILLPIDMMPLGLGAGVTTIVGDQLAGSYTASTEALGVVDDAIEEVFVNGRADLASGGRLLVGRLADALLGRGLLDTDGALTLGVRRDAEAPTVTSGTLEGTTWGVAMLGNALFFDPASEVVGLPHEAARASIRFRQGGQVERYDLDPEFVLFNPAPAEVGSYQVLGGNILEITWAGAGGQPVVSRFEVAPDLRTLVPLRSTIGAETEFGFGVGVLARSGEILPPLDLGPPDDPGDPGGDGDGGGGGPDAPEPFMLRDMEAVSVVFDAADGAASLLIEFQRAGAEPPSFGIIDLRDAIGAAPIARPSVMLSGDGSTIHGLALTAGGLIAFASRPDGTFLVEAAGGFAPTDQLAGPLSTTTGFRVDDAPLFAKTNGWYVALRRTTDQSVHLLRALGDVDADGIVEFERTAISEVAAEPDGPAPFIGDNAATLLHTPWGALAYAYTADDGHVWAIWTTPALDGTWFANDLTDAAGATAGADPQATLAAAATGWGSIHLAFVTPGGDVRQLWWEWQRGTWLEHLTEQEAGLIDLGGVSAARFDRATGSITIIATEPGEGGSVVALTWDIASDLWRPLDLGGALGNQRRAFGDAFVRTVSGRVDLVGRAGSAVIPEIVWAAGLTLTFDGGPGADLAFDYVIARTGEGAPKGVALTTDDLLVYEALQLDL